MKYILGSDSITVYHDGNSHTVNKQSDTFQLVLNAVKNNDAKALESALNIKESIVSELKASTDKVSIANGEIWYEDRQVHGLIVSRVFEMLRLGLDVKPLVKFLENIMLNPSKRAVDELFGFMEACSLPITEDGHFLAYKRVRGDYKDCHSGTISNKVGEVVTMERNMVDEDKNNTCSYGLHFCSYDYLKHFGGERIVVLKINPKDVVAVPSDYNNSKGRCCAYTVVDEIRLNDYKLPEKELDQELAMDFGYEEQEDDFPIHKLRYHPDSPSSTKKSAVKLTERDVIAIRKAYEIGDSTKYIAETFGISKRQARRIRDRESWKNV